MADNDRVTAEAEKQQRALELRAWLLDLYARIVSTELPPDAYLGGFLRRRSQIRGSGRGFLAATLFALLRKRQRTVLLYRFAATSPTGPLPEIDRIDGLDPGEEAAAAIVRWLVEDQKIPSGEALQDLTAQVQFLAAQAHPDSGPVDWQHAEGLLSRAADFIKRFEADPNLATAPSDARIAARYSLPIFLLRRWEERFDEEEAGRLAESLQRTAPLHLRLFRSAPSVPKLLPILQQAGAEAAPGDFSPTAVRLVKKVDLRKIPALQSGWYEVQDEGSQLVSLAVGVQGGWRVLDACAGAGGKALHLADVEPRAAIFAHDLEAARLKPLHERRERAALRNITILEPGTARTAAPFDAVLIDAPCMGLGRLRREPSAAWRAHLPERLAEVTRLQRICLEDYAPLVRPGGIVVYATCSFEPEETTEMLCRFMAEHPEFEPDPLPSLFNHEALKRLQSADRSQVTLVPSIHGTDGFFIGRMRRR